MKDSEGSFDSLLDSVIGSFTYDVGFWISENKPFDHTLFLGYQHYSSKTVIVVG